MRTPRRPTGTHANRPAARSSCTRRRLMPITWAACFCVSRRGSSVCIFPYLFRPAIKQIRCMLFYSLPFKSIVYCLIFSNF